MAARMPVALTSFVGRQREIEELHALLADRRLVTVVGVGGVGKTRLVMEAVSSLAERFPGGVWWADLAAVSDPALVLNPLLDAVGRGDAATLPGLIRRLRRRHGLLVLDNCERVAAACAPLAEELLVACPQLAILATSREPLRSAAETRWRLAPLAVPPSEPRARRTADESDAVRLFVARAQAVDTGFELDGDNTDVVADICRRLDGIPLALELAAARVHALSLREIRERLDQRLDLLRDGPGGARAQHRTLRAALDWSYEALPLAEQRLLRRLAVFAGGWTLAAAEAVCGEDASAVADDLGQLVTRSLVVAEHAAGDRRYRLLETVREYALEKLAAAGELRSVRDRHLAWSVHVMQRLGPAIRGGDQTRVFAELTVEHENLAEALEWSIASHAVEAGLRIVGELWWFWFPCGHARQGARLLDRLLALPETAGLPDLRAGALEALAVLERDLGGNAKAIAAAEEGLAIRRRLGDRLGIAESLVIAGWTRVFSAEFEAAYAHWSENLALAQALGADWNAAEAAIDLGWLDAVGGDFAGARERLDRGIAAMRRLGSDVYLAYGLFFGAYASLFEGRCGEARTRLAESLAIYRRVGGRRLLDPALSTLAAVAAREGAAAVAVRLSGATSALREALGLAQFPGFHDRLQVEVDGAWRALGRRAPVAFAEGRETDFEQLLDEALGYAETGARKRPASAPLSDRQAIVAGLAADGLSNREIAAALSLAEGTVKRHVEDILMRLGMQNRAQIAAWAVQNLAASTRR